MAGGFDPTGVREYVALAFGRIPGGARPPRAATRVPAARGGRDALRVAADSSMLLLAWPTPPWAHEDAPLLELFAYALAARLAEDPGEGVGDVAVEAVATELAGGFTISLTHAPTADVAQLEARIRSALSDALEALTPAELAAAAAAERERIAAYHEELGWIGGRIELVGESLVFADDPEHYRRRLERQGSATVDVVTRAAREWLGQLPFVLEVEGTGAR